MNPWEVNWSQPNQTPSPDVKPWEVNWSNKTDNYLPNTAALKKGFAGDPLAVFNGPERIRLENILSTYDNPEEEGKKHIIAQYLAPRVKLPPETVLNNFQYSVDAFFGKKNTKVNDAYNQIGELLNPKPYQPVPETPAFLNLGNMAMSAMTKPDGINAVPGNMMNAAARGTVTLAGGLAAYPDVLAGATTDLINYPYNAYQTWIAQKPERQLWYRESFAGKSNYPRSLGEFLNNDVAKLIEVEQINQSLFDSVKSGDYESAAKTILYGVSENIPQYAALILTNKAALMAKVGQTVDEATRARLIGDIGLMAISASAAGTKSIQLKDVPGDPGLKHYNALMNQLFEATSERIFNLSILEKYFANAGVKQKVLKAGTEWIKDIFKGGAGEATAQFSENVTDNVSGLGNQPLLANVLEATVIGGLMEGSPGALNMYRVIRAARTAPPISYHDLEQLNTIIRERARQRKEELLQKDDLSDAEVAELRRATNDEQNPSPANTIVDAMLAEPDQQPADNGFQTENTVIETPLTRKEELLQQRKNQLQENNQDLNDAELQELRQLTDAEQNSSAANTVANAVPVDPELQAAEAEAGKARREHFDERARRQNETPVHLDQIQTAADEVATAFPGVKVVVVNAFEELPEQAKNEIAADPAMSTTAGRARGVYVSTDDTVYLIANNLNVADVPTVMFHEALGHKGFYDYLGNQLMPLADKIFGDITAAVQQYNNDNKLGFDLELPAGQRQATLEYVASIAESIVQRGASRPAWWKGVLFQIKQTLRNIPGLKNIRFTDREIEGILAKSYQKMLENKQESEQQDGGISFSVIGEQGAANLDKAQEVKFRTENLAIAREMETANKTAKDIRMATGWERGADNLWRYELNDSSIEIIGDFKLIGNDAQKWYSVDLDNLIDAPELFEAYPELKKIRVEKNQTLSPATEAVWKSSKVERDHGVSIGAIQFNTRFFDVTFRKPSDESRARIKELESTPEYKEYQEKSSKLSYLDIESEKLYRDFNNSTIGKELNVLLYEKTKLNGYFKKVLFHETQHAIQTIAGFAPGGNEKSVSKLYKELSDDIELINLTAKQYYREGKTELYNQAMERRDKKVKAVQKLVGETGFVDGLTGYNKLAGEVESRNTEKRLDFTDEQRRNTLLAETEDVAREDQIFLENTNTDYSGDNTAFSIPGHENSLTLEEIANDPTIKAQTIIPAPDGKQHWGEITPEIARKAGLQPGLIMMFKGAHFNPHNGYGVVHINIEHGEDFARIGYVPEKFIHNIMQNFDEIFQLDNGKIGLVKHGRPRGIGIIQLRYENGYYSIVSAYPEGDRYYNEMLKGVNIWKRAARNARYSKQQAVSPEPLSGSISSQPPLDVHGENVDTVKLSPDSFSVNEDFKNNVSFSLAPAKYNTKQTEPAVKIEYRREKWLTFNNTTIRGPADMAFAFQGLRDSAIERAFITGLKDGKPVCVQPIGFGSNKMSVVFMANAIDMLKKFGCDTAYLVHNHPSGNIQPSDADFKLNSKAKNILDTLNIKFAGHVIIDTTKFTHVDENNIAAEFEHASRDGKGVKVPVLEQYAVWKNSNKTSDYPIVTTPRQVFEVFKGWELDMFGTLVMFADVKNKILHAELIPVELIDAKTLMEKAAATNSTRFFIAAQSMSDTDKHRLGMLNHFLKDVNMWIDDVVIGEKDSHSFQSLQEQGKIAQVQDAPGKYSFSLKDIPNTDLIRLGTILVPGIMRGQIKSWEDAKAYFDSQGIDGLEEHEIMLAHGEGRRQMEDKKKAKKKKDREEWFKANHPVLWDIEAKIGAGMKIKPDAKYGRKKDVTGYYVDWKNGMPSDEAAKYLGIHEDELIDLINGVKTTDLKQQFTAWKHEKNDEDAYWEKLAYEERQRETATIIDDVVTGKLKLTPDLRKSNPEAAQGIYELITGTDKMPPNDFDWDGAMDALIRRSQGVENWQLPPAKAAAIGTIDPNAPPGLINEADASKIYDQGFAAGTVEGKEFSDNEYLLLIESMNANQKDIVVQQKKLKEFAYANLPAGERDIVLNSIIQLANASNTPTVKYPDGERRHLLEKIMNKFRKIRDASLKEQLLERIQKRLKQTTAKRSQTGIPISTYDDSQKILDRIREIVRLTPGMVYNQISYHKEKAELALANDGDDSADNLELEMLNTFGVLEGKTSEQLKVALNEIQQLAHDGRAKFLIKIASRREENETKRQEAIKDFSGGKGLMWKDEAEIAEAKFAKMHVIGGLEQAHKAQLNLTWFFNNITRKSGKHLEDTLCGKFAYEQHIAENKEKMGKSRRIKAFNAEFDRIFSTHGLFQSSFGKITSRGKKLTKLQEIEKESGVFKYQRPPDGEKGIEYSRLTVEEAQAMINDHAEGINHLQDFEVECIKHQLDDIDAGEKYKSKNDAAIEDEMMKMIAAENAAKTPMVILPRIKDIGKLKEQPLSQAKALTAWLNWQQPNVRYKMQFNGWTNDSIKQLEKFLMPEMRALGKWMVNELEADYSNVNEVFRTQWHTELPHSENYFPTSYAQNKTDSKTEILGLSFGVASVSPGALKSRRFHLMEPNAEDAIKVWGSHMNKMEHFKALSANNRIMNAIFNNANVKAALLQHHGEIAVNRLKQIMVELANGGRVESEVNKLYGAMYSRWAALKLITNIQSAGKQLFGSAAYLNIIPSLPFITGVADFLTAPVENARRLMNTDYFKNRFDGGSERDVSMLLDASASIAGKKIGWMNELIQYGSLPNRIGDALSIIIVGHSAYKYHYNKLIKSGLNPVEAEKQAIIKWEIATDLTQQSSSVMDMNHYQLGGLWERVLTMFQSNPILAMQQQTETALDFIAGRNTAESAAKLGRMIMLNHVIIPFLMMSVPQFIKNGFDWDEYEAEDYLAAMFLGPYSSAFVVGKGLEAIMLAIMGKYQKTFSVIPMGDELSRAYLLGEKIVEGNADLTTDNILKGVEVFGSALATFMPAGVVAGAAARESRRWFKFFSEDKPKHKKKDTGIL